jgi:hypothetical protein
MYWNDIFLCRGWKDLVDEWVKSAGDVAAAAMAGEFESGLKFADEAIQFRNCYWPFAFLAVPFFFKRCGRSQSSSSLRQNLPFHPGN